MIFVIKKNLLTRLSSRELCQHPQDRDPHYVGETVGTVGGDHRVLITHNKTMFH